MLSLTDPVSRTRRWLPVALLGALVIGAVFLLQRIYMEFRADTVAQAGRQVELAAAIKADALQRSLGEYHETLQVIAADERVRQTVRDGPDAARLRAVQGLLTTVDRVHGRLLCAVTLADASGVMVSRPGPGWCNGPFLPARAVRTGTPERSGHLHDVNGRWLLHLVTPIRDEGPALGRVEGWLDLHAMLERLLGDVHPYRGGHAYAVRPDGTVLWHPIELAAGDPEMHGAAAAVARLSAQTGTATPAGSGELIRGDHAVVDGQVIAYAPVQWFDERFYVTVTAPLSAVLEPTVSFVSDIVVLGGTLLGLIIVGSAIGAFLHRRHLAALSELRNILRISPAVIYRARVVGDRLVPTFVSDTVQGILGYAPGQIGDSEWWLERIDPRDRKAVRDGHDRLLGDGRLAQTFRVHTADGDVRWLQENVAVIRDDRGTTGEVVGALLDVTAHSEAAASRRLADSFFEHSEELCMVLDADRRILRVNRAFTRITGYAAHEILGAPVADGRYGDEDVFADEAVWRQLESTGSWQGEARRRRRTGESYRLWVTLTAIRGDDGHVTHYTLSGLEVSRGDALEARLYRMTNYDDVTGLPNRNVILDRLQHMLTTDSARGGGGIAVLFADIRRFSRIHETLGPHLSEQVLRAIGERLDRVVRPAGGLVGRYGNDTFLVLLRAGPGHLPCAAETVAEGMVASVEAPIPLGEQTIFTDLNIGVAIAPDDGHDVERLVIAAMTATRRAQQSAVIRYSFFQADFAAHGQRRLTLENRLRTALDDSALSLHYQPQIRLEDGEVVGAEALLRWHDAELGPVSPAEFIPVAEESGLIEDIGAWVLEQACHEAAAWPAAGLGTLRVGVNLSLRQFRSDTLVETVDRALAASGLPADRLELEITEGTAISDAEATAAALTALRERGITVAVDDFGTGYASLSYLHSLPVDTMKIDRSFVQSLDSEPRSAEIARAIISLSHTLGLRVIAEGAEMPEHVTFLRREGCDEVQGFHFSRPLPAAAFRAWVIARDRA
ncbi:bifunctional diguanylate cyclase/phosphodiesterase [Arhodomonas aquaeolei]|uniref:bifunctional diguanylate cyclase/phosphodiesterase n=1 Tax=Arhodomonas aquaeolei TaxID=2369 RepID=UPI000367D337|nr:EAL domain-containing protein [Arhodomonas aquaeolei]